MLWNHSWYCAVHEGIDSQNVYHGFQRFLALWELGPKSRAAGSWRRGGAEARNRRPSAAALRERETSGTHGVRTTPLSKWRAYSNRPFSTGNLKKLFSTFRWQNYQVNELIKTWTRGKCRCLDNEKSSWKMYEEWPELIGWCKRRRLGGPPHHSYGNSPAKTLGELRLIQYRETLRNLYASGYYNRIQTIEFLSIESELVNYSICRII